jgi:hypothetical protein
LEISKSIEKVELVEENSSKEEWKWHLAKIIKKTIMYNPDFHVQIEALVQVKIVYCFWLSAVVKLNNSNQNLLSHFCVQMRNLIIKFVLNICGVSLT